MTRPSPPSMVTSSCNNGCTPISLQHRAGMWPTFTTPRRARSSRCQVLVRTQCRPGRKAVEKDLEMFLCLFEALVKVVLQTGLRELLAELVAEKGVAGIARERQKV